MIHVFKRESISVHMENNFAILWGNSTNLALGKLDVPAGKYLLGNIVPQPSKFTYLFNQFHMAAHIIRSDSG